MFRIIGLSALLTAAPLYAVVSQDVCVAAAGASFIADDGEFLGKVTGSLDSQSIFNEIGRFGSEISQSSIWNKIGRYGSEISNLSPFNRISSSPPALVKGGEVIGYLTVNRVKSGAINPWVLKSCDF